MSVKEVIKKLNRLKKDDARLKVCDIATEEGIKFMKKFNDMGKARGED